MSVHTFNFGSQQMKVYLRDFLESIRSLIFEIKTHVYQISDLEPDYHCLQNPKVYPNFHSILKNCSQTSEDLKRINYMLKGYTVNKESQAQSKCSYTNFFKQTPNRYQVQQNNITFQNFPDNDILFSSKTDPLFFDGLTINSQNDFNKLNASNLNPKIHWRNKTETQLHKGKSDKQPTDVQSYAEALTKRTNFTTLKKKSPDIGLRGTIDSVNEISHFSIQNGLNAHFYKESEGIKGVKIEHQRNESMSFTFHQSPVEESIKSSKRCSKIQDQHARRDSKCLEIIKSLRKQLSR